MIKNRIIIFLGLGLSLVSCHQKQEESIKPFDGSKNYQLSWNEEFDYTGLPDTNSWGYEVGYIRNGEAQYYTHARMENVRVEDGMLVIESRKEAYEGYQYTSASINTLGKVSFPVNSRLEVRAKLPAGKGIWPAIWCMGTDFPVIGWPRCGEIDIMEFVGHTPNTVWATFHWWDALKPDSSIHLAQGDSTLLYDLHNNFHVYGVERKESRLDFFIDTNYYFSYELDTTIEQGLLTHPYYLLINTAIGGSWGGEIDTSMFPQKFYIDWVRAFEIPVDHQGVE